LGNAVMPRQGILKRTKLGIRGLDFVTFGVQMSSVSFWLDGLWRNAMVYTRGNVSQWNIVSPASLCHVKNKLVYGPRDTSKHIETVKNSRQIGLVQRLLRTNTT
jgi:hypothetical protein